MRSKAREMAVFAKSPDGFSKLYYLPEGQYYRRRLLSAPELERGAHLPLCCVSVNDQHCFAGDFRQRENSNVFAVEYVLEGVMEISRDGVDYEVRPGEAYFVLHGRNIMTQPGGAGRYCHRMSCIMEGRALNVICDSLGLGDKDVVRGLDAVRVEALMKKLYAEMEACAPGFRERQSVLCYELLVALSEAEMQEPLTGVIRKVLAIFEMHIAEKITLKSVSTAVGISARSLNTAFRAAFGIAPMEYLIRMRMEKAMTLLRESPLPIQEIAYRCGYANGLYFSAEFRKRTGLSPRNWREHPSTPPPPGTAVRGNPAGELKSVSEQ